jgi:predicted nucleic acid-binding Zn ribbon protein
MARQEDTCWRCGTQWASEDGPRTTLKVITGGAQAEDRTEPAVAVAARAASDARLDADRWANEGGSLASQAAARLRWAREQLNVPVYVYRRLDGSTFETQQRMAEDALVACPTTGQSVERVLQLFTPRYKGTGFYSTDHRTPNGSGQSPGPPGDGERSRRGNSAHEAGGAAAA